MPMVNKLRFSHEKKIKNRMPVMSLSQDMQARKKQGKLFDQLQQSDMNLCIIVFRNKMSFSLVNILPYIHLLLICQKSLTKHVF